MFDITGYQVHKKIGEGGSSEVWLATRLQSKRIAALKLLHAKYSGDPAMRKRLAREAKVIGGLRHPNIVKIFRHGTINERFFMLLEYLAKGSGFLMRLLKPTELKPPEPQRAPAVEDCYI